MALLNPTIYETRQKAASVDAIAALGIKPLCYLLILLELVLKWKFCFESWSVIMTSTFLVESSERVQSHSSLNLMSQCWLFLYSQLWHQLVTRQLRMASLHKIGFRVAVQITCCQVMPIFYLPFFQNIKIPELT